MAKPIEPLNVWSFKPGQVLRVVKTFKDGGGNTVEKGTILHFEERNFLPYHDGHTVYFKEVTLYLCGLDDTGDIVENRGNEFFESYPPEPDPHSRLSQADRQHIAVTIPPRRAPSPIIPPAPPISEPPKPAPPKMPHMRFADMYLELRVSVVQTFRDANGHEYPEGLEMRFLQFNGTAYVFLERTIRLEAGDPILENADNTWLRPLPRLESLTYGLEFLYRLRDANFPREVQEALNDCNKWLSKPKPRGDPPQFAFEGLPFPAAFVFKGVKYLLET